MVHFLRFICFLFFMPAKKTTTRKAAPKKKTAATRTSQPSSARQRADAAYHKVVAEFLGTFTLTLAVILSSASGLATPLVAALTLGLFVYTIGGISGSHINPAVTIGMLSINKITSGLAARYIVAQILGGLLAMLVVVGFNGGQPNISFLHSEIMSPAIAVSELFGAFFFVFGITAVVSGRVRESLSGIVVGGSLLLGIIVATSLFQLSSDPVTVYGFLNPAVALGHGIGSPMYMIGPIAGAILGALTYSWLAKK